MCGIPVIFYPKVGVKNLCIACTLGFSLAVGFSIGLFFLENPADHGFKNENSVAIVGGLSIVLYGTMLILSVYSWISYHYTQLSLDESGVSFQTLAQNNQLAWTDLKSVEWVMQGYHGGIIIYSPITSFRVGLREFSRQDRLEIIRLLNGQILEDAQTGWPQFCHRFVIPLVNSVEQTEVNIQEMRSGKSSFEDNKERVEITRQRYDRFALVLLPASVAVSLLLFKLFELMVLISMPLMIVAGWILLRFSIPKEGIREYRITATLQGKSCLVVFGMIMVSFAVMFILPIMNVHKSVAYGFGIVIMLLAIPPIFDFLNQAEKIKNEGVDESVSQWVNYERSWFTLSILTAGSVRFFDCSFITPS